MRFTAMSGSRYDSNIDGYPIDRIAYGTYAQITKRSLMGGIRQFERGPAPVFASTDFTGPKRK